MNVRMFNLVLNTARIVGVSNRLVINYGLGVLLEVGVGRSVVLDSDGYRVPVVEGSRIGMDKVGVFQFLTE